MTMAASAPPSTMEKSTMGASWTEPQSTSRVDTQGLQMGMSGMRLVNTTPSRRPPALSGSSFSNTDEPASRQHSYGSISLPSADYNYGGNSGTPPPPASPLIQKSLYSKKAQSIAKPPGLGGFSVPSPIGKNSTTNNTLSSSPNLTLTPSSSVDGNSELFGSFALQDSPHVDAADGGLSRSPWSDFGNGFGKGKEGFIGVGAFDTDPDDGLHGLGALRDRAYSSPGPVINGLLGTSPPVRIDFSTHQGELSPLHSDVDSRQRGFPPDRRRIRTTKDTTGVRHSSRPPLSGGGSLSQSPYNLEVSQTDINRFLQGDLYGRQDINFSNLDGSGGHMRSRSSGGIGIEHLTGLLARGTQYESNEHPHHHLIDQSHSHKFGTLPNLNAHIHQQLHRNPPHAQQSALPPQSRHMRSFSHSGALQQSSIYSQDAYDEKSLGRSFDGRLQHSHGRDAESMYSGDITSGIFPQGHGLGRSISAGDNLSQGFGMGQRSANLSQPNFSGHLASALGGPQLQRRASDVNQGGFAPYGGQQGAQYRLPQYQQRRQDFNPSQPGLSSQLDAYHGGPELQRRNSDGYQSSYANFGGQQGGRQPPYQQRREDFNQSSRYDDGSAPVMATPDEMRLFNMNISAQEGNFGHSQNSVRQNNPSMGGRRQGDLSRSLSSSPMSGDGGQRQRSGSNSTPNSHSTGVLPNFHNPSYHGQYNMDDDLSHPLAGENICDPGDDHGIGNGMSTSMTHQLNQHNSYGQGPPVMHVNRHFSTPMERSTMGINPYGHVDSVSHHHLNVGLTSPRPAVYNVKFKRTQRTFIVGPRVHGELKMGCYVKVEADRGEDLGIIVGKVAPEKFNGPGRPSYRSGLPSPPGMHGDMGMMGPPGTGVVADLKRITRLATQEEVGLLNVKREEEEELLSICRTKCRQRALPMTVVDAEYQFDRHKLTFFFEAEGRIDFRELVRDLFSMYKTRIWMQQLDKNCGGVIGAGPLSAPHAGSEYGAALGSINQMVDYPTEPVFAPPSEMVDFASNAYY